LDFGELPYEQPDSTQELLLDLMMRAAEQITNRRAEQQFVGDERLKFGCLFEPLMPGDTGAAFRSENEGDLLLSETGSFAKRADVVWQLGSSHRSWPGLRFFVPAWYNGGMAFADWIGHNWFALVQTGALAGGFLLTCTAILLDARARRVANLIQLTQQHRDLWERMYLEPDLSRILDPAPDLTKNPVTSEEEVFVIFLILHLSSSYSAMRSGFFQKPHGLRKDIERFFSLPIPRAVWNKVKVLQDVAFANFVECCTSSTEVTAER
jgi:hypothetical protein